MDHLKLKFLIFTAGFCILSLEIVGMRILGPYVGTAVPVWASLIGITLLGSAAGYYGGGWLADSIRKPFFMCLAFTASAWIACIPMLRSILSVIAVHYSSGIGSLLGSLLLFFIPAVFLSGLVTYGIRASVKGLHTIAQVHGDLYSLATLGSIIGVFFTSYILIPSFTVSSILYGLSTLLFLAGILPIVPKEVSE